MFLISTTQEFFCFKVNFDDILDQGQNWATLIDYNSKNFNWDVKEGDLEKIFAYEMTTYSTVLDVTISIQWVAVLVDHDDVIQR